MSDWKKVKLADLGEIVGGGTPSTKDSSNYEGGTIPWITPKDLSNFHSRYIFVGERNITKKGLNSSSATMMPKNTILFSSRAPIGYIAIAGNELCTNQGFKSIIPNEKKVDYLFLYYLLKYSKEKIEGLGGGTTFKEVSGTVMKNVEVFIPERIDDQRKIGHLLDSLDLKIELNNQINDNLSNYSSTESTSISPDISFGKSESRNEDNAFISFSNCLISSIIGKANALNLIMSSS